MSMTRRLLTVVLVSVLGCLAVGAQAPPKQAGGEAKVTWYFYTVKWGLQDEFLDLFQRNHYPVLKARLDAGHYASIRTFTPTYHGDGRADWTFAVELIERAGTTGAPTEQEIIKKLYPDQAKFRKEEQRRFELLEAHWDKQGVPHQFLHGSYWRSLQSDSACTSGREDRRPAAMHSNRFPASPPSWPPPGSCAGGRDPATRPGASGAAR